MHTDTLADMLIRLKNATAVKKKHTIIPLTKMNKAVLSLLESEKYIASFSEVNTGTFPMYQVNFKYVDGSSAIQHLRKISKPGVRIYTKFSDLKPTLSGYGLKIISTSKGVMTDKEARKQKIGGEVLAELW